MTLGIHTDEQQDTRNPNAYVYVYTSHTLLGLFSNHDTFSLR